MRLGVSLLRSGHETRCALRRSGHETRCVLAEVGA